MLCTHCNNTIEAGDVFCENCGQKVGGSIPSAKHGSSPSPGCARCGNAIEPGDAFCEGCGQSIAGVSSSAYKNSATSSALKCPNCSTPYESGDAFCEGCGQKIAGVSPPQRTPAVIPPSGPQPSVQATRSNANQARIPLIFLLDTSASATAYTANLSDALNHFKSEVSKDKLAQDILDIAVVQFSDSFEVVRDFTPIAGFSTPRLIADGSANYSSAIGEALTMADAKTRYGGSSYKPWIILISGSAPSDNISDISNEIQRLHNAERLRFMALGVNGNNSATLKQLTDVVFRMNDTNFTPFFDWISGCMSAIARSKPDEKPQLPNLEGNVYRDR